MEEKIKMEEKKRKMEEKPFQQQPSYHMKRMTFGLGDHRIEHNGWEARYECMREIGRKGRDTSTALKAYFRKR